MSSSGSWRKNSQSGIFVLPIPNAVDNLGLYAVAIVAGMIFTAAMLVAVKKPLPKAVVTG